MSGSKVLRSGSGPATELLSLIPAAVVIAAAGSARKTARSGDPLGTQLNSAKRAEAQGDWVTAAQAYRQAASLSADPSISLRLAYALLRAGKPTAAAEAAESIRHSAPDNPDAVLILGLAQRAVSDPAAGQTLSRFLAIAPRYPAAAEAPVSGQRDR